MRATRPLALFAALSASALAAQASASPNLVPHRAVYDLALAEATERSGITGLTGRMVYEFLGSACEGYSVKFRFVTKIETGEGSRLTDQQTTTYEDGEGRTFSFVTRSFVDRARDKVVKGEARQTGDATVVELEQPQPRELSLPPSQFPTRHMIELLNKATAGERFYETTLFDGSDDADEIMTTTIIIGDRQAAETEAAGEPVPDEPFWPVSIAYFDSELEGGEEVPVYSISFKLHPNGVTRDLHMDYGDFAMIGRLVDLDLYDTAEEDCR
jgi:hypothetical protein